MFHASDIYFNSNRQIVMSVTAASKYLFSEILSSYIRPDVLRWMKTIAVKKRGGWRQGRRQ